MLVLWPVVFVVGHVATLAMGVALTVVAALVVKLFILQKKNP